MKTRRTKASALPEAVLTVAPPVEQAPAAAPPPPRGICQSCGEPAVHEVMVVGKPMELCAACMPPMADAEQVLNGQAPWTLLHGDCLELLRSLPDACVDAIVTDPPSGISFMQKEWDSDKGGRDHWVTWLEQIFVELRRVAKPGAHAMVWSLPRTSHWTATAVENAGWAIRDRLCHIFGSGFPKSANVSKQIDKQHVSFVDAILEGPSPPPDSEGNIYEGWRRIQLRVVGAERPVLGMRTLTGNAAVSTKDKGGTYGVQVGTAPAIEVPITGPATEDAKKWDGWGTALKPAVEDWWVARSPLSEETVAKNVLKWGTGALNIDATRIYTDWKESDRPESWKESGHSAKPDADKIAAPPGEGIECHPLGRWPANLSLTHSPSCRLVGAKEVARPLKAKAGAADSHGIYGDGLNQAPVILAEGIETQPVFACAEDCPVKLLDEQSGDRQSGVMKAGTKRHHDGGYSGSFPEVATLKDTYGDSGTASRFFQVMAPETQEGVDECEEAGCAQDCPIRLLNEQSGELPAGTAVRHSSGGNTFGGDTPKPAMADAGYGDKGAAARFFSTFEADQEAVRFRYLPKPSTAEREFGLEDFAPEAVNDGRETEIDNPYQRGETPRRNTHVTVKGIALMRWLIRLGTPPGGIVLDPFAGSGTTLIAARREGFRAIGIEKEAASVSIARARISRWEQVQPELDEAEAIRQAHATAHAKDRRQQALF